MKIRNKQRAPRRLAAVLLSAVLMLGLLPAAALAAGPVEVGTAAALTAAAADGGEIVLTGNIDLTKTLEIGKTCSIDTGNYTLTVTPTGQSSGISIPKDVTLTLRGSGTGSVVVDGVNNEATAQSKYVLGVQCAGSLTLESGVLTVKNTLGYGISGDAQGQAFKMTGGTLNITDCGRSDEGGFIWSENNSTCEFLAGTVNMSGCGDTMFGSIYTHCKELVFGDGGTEPLTVNLANDPAAAVENTITINNPMTVKSNAVINITLTGSDTENRRGVNTNDAKLVIDGGVFNVTSKYTGTGSTYGIRGADVTVKNGGAADFSGVQQGFAPRTKGSLTAESSAHITAATLDGGYDSSELTNTITGGSVKLDDDQSVVNGVLTPTAADKVKVTPVNASGEELLRFDLKGAAGTGVAVAADTTVGSSHPAYTYQVGKDHNGTAYVWAPGVTARFYTVKDGTAAEIAASSRTTIRGHELAYAGGAAPVSPTAGMRYVWYVGAKDTVPDFKTAEKWTENTPLTENMYLYTNGDTEKIPTYTVTYAANGGSGTMTDRKTYLPGDTVTVQDNTFVRKGYTFAGWTASAEDSAAPTLNNGTFPMPAANVTLTAQWEKKWDIDKSKTASPTALTDSDLTTKVTLSLPSAEVVHNKVEVVFVVDKSGYADIADINDATTQMLQTLKNQTAMDISIGVVKFDAWGVDGIAMSTGGKSSGMLSLKDHYDTVKTAVTTDMSLRIGGTNTEQPIRMANAMLAAGDPDAEKYVVVFSDFHSYVYEGSATVGGKTCDHIPVGSAGSYHTNMSGLEEFGSYAGYLPWSALKAAYDANGKSLPGSDWTVNSQFFRGTDQAQDNWLAYENAGGGAYDTKPATLWTKQTTADYAANDTALNQAAKDQKLNHVTGYQRSMLLTYDAMEQSLDAGYHVVAYRNEGDGRPNGKTWNEYLGGIFSDMLADAEKIGVRVYEESEKDSVKNALDALTSSITYLMGSGTVTDVIGEKFDLVTDGTPFTLTVGGRTQTVTKTGENEWSFGTLNANTQKYPYVVNTSSANGERFVWTINVPVERANTVQLSYTLKLNDTSVTATYPTNASAVLDYQSSDGKTGGSELFEVPRVTYTKSGGGGTVLPYTLFFEENGGSAVTDISASAGTKIDLTPYTSTREGYTFGGWYSDKALTTRVTDVTLNGNRTVYAKWTATEKPDLFRDDHVAYVIGYKDGTVRPNANISRAEVATIFFRLLDDDVREKNLTTTNSFSDVNDRTWCNDAVSTLSAMGIVHGRANGTFDGTAAITRAEFAAIAARFDSSAYSGADKFSDISGHWAEEMINRAAARGWILGYSDGTFKPQRNITRAEAMTTINRVLGRLPETGDDLLTGMNTWTDNRDVSAWYYLAVQEATNSHDHKMKSDSVHETWTGLTATPDWAKYER